LKKIIATVGPSLLFEQPISGLHKKEYIYRINGAHGDRDSIISYIEEIRKQVPDAQILMDLPGNKVRTKISAPIKIENGKPFSMKHAEFNYSEFYKHLHVGDLIYANDSIFQFTVESIDAEKINFLSHSDGLLNNNKGFHVRGIHEHIPFLFEKDLGLISIANEFDLAYVGLSFVRTASDIAVAREKVKSGIEIIAKVETKAAVANLDSILQAVQYILVDRGDLSTEIGLEKIPAYQKFIIERALFFNKNVFLATQFLKTMEEKPVPTFPEVIDLYNTMKSGVFGIQLSEETAIGKYPRGCLDVVDKILGEIRLEMIG
jgi:pyruvate kinase